MNQIFAGNAHDVKGVASSPEALSNEYLIKEMVFNPFTVHSVEKNPSGVESYVVSGISALKDWLTLC
jgi:hypothetical protein